MRGIIGCCSFFWPYRIEVSSPDFQSGDVGALPTGATNFANSNPMQYMLAMDTTESI